MQAIIPAAGLGTRFLPATKSIPKEMLPIGNKPALQWLVEEALRAGAAEVIIVTSPTKPAIRQHFTTDVALCRLAGKNPVVREAMEHLERISAKVRFVEQTEQLGLGHAVSQTASLCAGNNHVLVLLGDALVSGVECCSRELMEVSQAHGGCSVVGLEEVPQESLSKYGIVAGKPVDQEGRVWRLDDVVEKPDVAHAPSRLAIAGRYLLETRVFDLLADLHAGQGGEIQLTDAIRLLLMERAVCGVRYRGKRHDIGNPAGYRAALNAFGSQSAESNKRVC